MQITRLRNRKGVVNIRDKMFLDSQVKTIKQLRLGLFTLV